MVSFLVILMILENIALVIKLFTGGEDVVQL
jgi:hypothetical protein